MKLILRGAAALAALALIFGAAESARAQSPNINPFSVKIGAFLPSKGETKDAGGSGMLMIEAEYKLPGFSEMNSDTVISIGYTDKSDFRLIPITISQIMRSPETTGRASYYYGLGLGIYATRLTIPGSSADGENKNLFGGFAVVGYDIKDDLFAEAKYHYVSKYNDKTVNGIQLALGYRF